LIKARRLNPAGFFFCGKANVRFRRPPNEIIIGKLRCCFREFVHRE